MADLRQPLPAQICAVWSSGLHHITPPRPRHTSAAFSCTHTPHGFQVFMLSKSNGNLKYTYCISHTGKSQRMLDQDGADYITDCTHEEDGGETHAKGGGGGSGGSGGGGGRGSMEEEAEGIGLRRGEVSPTPTKLCSFFSLHHTTPAHTPRSSSCCALLTLQRVQCPYPAY